MSSVTVLRSRSKTVEIGADRPFCVIGERINPTGRKKFAEDLRAGELSTVTHDALAQVEAGANMLDVNAGIPLVDESELLKAMLKTVQQAVDVPICIDSSVIEALEAGLSVYEGTGARELGHRRGRAPFRDSPARRPARRGRDRARQRRDRDPGDAREAARMCAQDRCGRRRARDRARRRRDRPAGDDGRRRPDGRTYDARDDQPDPGRARREHVPRRVERLVRPAAAARAERRRSSRWRWRPG